MKKKFALLTLVVAMAGAITACGGLNPNKYVTLPEYTGIKVTVEPKAEVTGTDVTDYIQSALTNSATYQEVDRAVQADDQVNIDYVGTLDGKEFEGGSSKAYDLVIGSGSFIEGFEEGLIGAKKGDVLELNLTFPEDYDNATLKGQAVVFKVTINTIKENVVPELTDEYVASLSLKDCATVAEYNTYVSKLLTDKAQYNYDQSIQSGAFDIIYKGSKVTTPPEDMVTTYYDSYMKQVDQYATQYNVDRATIITSLLQMSEADFETKSKELSVDAAKQELVVRAIAKKEKIKVKDDEINDFAKENMAYYGYKTVDEAITGLGEDKIVYYLMNEKVMKFIQKNAVVKEQKGVSEEATVSQDATTEAVSDNTTEAVSDNTTETVSDDAATAK